RAVRVRCPPGRDGRKRGSSIASGSQKTLQIAKQLALADVRRITCDEVTARVGDIHAPGCKPLVTERVDQCLALRARERAGDEIVLETGRRRVHVEKRSLRAIHVAPE